MFENKLLYYVKIITVDNILYEKIVVKMQYPRSRKNICKTLYFFIFYRADTGRTLPCIFFLIME